MKRLSHYQREDVLHVVIMEDMETPDGLEVRIGIRFAGPHTVDGMRLHLVRL